MDGVFEKRLITALQRLSHIEQCWEGGKVFFFLLYGTNCLDLSSAGNAVMEISEKSFHLPELLTETLHEFSFYCFKQNFLFLFMDSDQGGL